MFTNIPPITKALLIANVIVFLLQATIGDRVFAQFELWPLGMPEPYASHGMRFMPWQLLTYGFMHGNLPHLMFNMLALLMFGAQLEMVWGQRRYLAYYLVCVVGAGLCQLLVASWMLDQGAGIVRTVGASGGVFGLLLGYGLLFPNQRVMLLIPPVPMKARTLVIVYGVISLLFGVTGTQSGVAHFAHLGGMIFGWLLIRYWRGQPPFGRRRGPRPPQGGRWM